jgi:hypothetical protein
MFVPCKSRISPSIPMSETVVSRFEHLVTSLDYALDLSGLGENKGLFPVAYRGMVWGMKLHQGLEFKRVPEKNNKIKIEIPASKLF